MPKRKKTKVRSSKSKHIFKVQYKQFVFVIISILVLIVILLFLVFNISNRQKFTLQVSQTPSPMVSKSVTGNVSPTLAPFNPMMQSEARKWEDDAYLVAVTNSDGTSATGVAGSEVYASHNTPDYYVLIWRCCGGPENKPKEYEIKPTGLIQLDDGYGDGLNVNQLLLNQDLMSNKQLIVNGNGVLNVQDILAKKEIHVSDSVNNDSTNSITISGKTFQANRVTVQTNNSKKYGLLYDVVFSIFSESGNKITALLSISSSGNIYFLNTY